MPELDLLTLLATPAPFRQWLAGQDRHTVVGLRFDGRHCPLACFLQRCGLPAPLVNDRAITHGAAVCRTPDWASAVITVLDCFDARTSEVHADEALRALGEVYEEEEERVVKQPTGTRLTLLAERRHTITHRLCFVCLAPIPDGEGTGHGSLGILTHQGTCSAIVDGEMRDATTSPRGRWRPRNDVLRRLQARRTQGKARAGEG